jgi:hypothetical protein
MDPIDINTVCLESPANAQTIHQRRDLNINHERRYGTPSEAANS